MFLDYFSIASFINILYGYYHAFFRGIGDFISINKAMLLSKCTQIIFAYIGLYLGYGLFAVAFSFFLSGVCLRIYLGIALSKFEKESFGTQQKMYLTLEFWMLSGIILGERVL